MIRPAISTSGTSKPVLLPHPGYLPWSEPLVRDLFCYILPHHGPTGPSLLIRREQGGLIYAQIGDWIGNVIEPDDSVHSLHQQVVELLETRFSRLANLLHGIGLQQAQFYFSGDLTLVDVRISANKFVGPGMLNDVFGKLVLVPKILKVEVLDSRVLDAVRNGSGSYSGDLIVKPSRYRDVELQTGKWTPLYVEVRG